MQTGVLTTRPLEDVVQGHSYQVEDLIEAQKKVQFINQVSLKLHKLYEMDGW